MGFSGLNWVAIRMQADRAQQAATNFILFSVDLVMPQVDRIMQILSGGYLDRIMAAKIRLSGCNRCYAIETFVRLSVGAQARAFAGSKIKGVKSPDSISYPVRFFSIFSLNAAEKSAGVQWALKAVDISTKNC